MNDPYSDPHFADLTQSCFVFSRDAQDCRNGVQRSQFNFSANFFRQEVRDALQGHRRCCLPLFEVSSNHFYRRRDGVWLKRRIHANLCYVYYIEI